MVHVSIRDLSVHYGRAGSRTTAVDGVSLEVSPGSSMGLVGESGSGKSTLAKALVGLAPVKGTLVVDGSRVDLDSSSDLRQLRSSVQMVFQDSSGSLNPRLTVGGILHDVARSRPNRGNISRAIGDAMEQVALSPALANRYPHELSGGQRQRVAIARALAAAPSVLVCDEVTSALDVSVQAQVINMLRGLRRDTGISLIFISHDLSVVRMIADEVAIMHHGKLVESGSTNETFANPRHDYTRALLGAVPSGIPRRGRSSPRSMVLTDRGGA